VLALLITLIFLLINLFNYSFKLSYNYSLAIVHFQIEIFLLLRNLLTSLSLVEVFKNGAWLSLELTFVVSPLLVGAVLKT